MIHWLHQFRWQSWLLWSGVVLLLAGFIAERNWHSLPGKHALETLAVTVLTLALAAALREFWRIRMADALLGIFAVTLLCFTGPLPVLATLLLAAAALGLGSVSAPRSGGATAMVVGVALIAGTLGWLLPFPLHYRFVYLLLLSGLVFLTRQPIRTAAHATLSAWRAAVDAEPAIAAFAVLVVGLASAGCWIPTVQYDDLAYHLGLPWQLTALGYYRMDAHSQIWALAPWSGDIVQAIAQVLAGEEARGAVDALWLCAAASVVWQIAGALETPVLGRWLSVALFASQPLTAALVGGMQAELPATATSLALALTVATAPVGANPRVIGQFAVLAGLLLGLKTGFIAIIAPLALWLLWRRRGQCSVQSIAAAVIVILLVGGSSYVYAYSISANPLLPLMNGVFHSSYIDPRNFSDSRWLAPVTWDFPWQLTFHTQQYVESWDGTAGFSLLALLGTIPIMLGSRRLRPLAAIGLFAIAAAAEAVHYFRYTYPALIMLTPCMVAAVLMATSRRAGVLLMGGVIALNLLYQGSSTWTLHSGAITRQIVYASPFPVLQRFAPERILLDSIRQQDPLANVVLCSANAPFAAEMAGRGFTTAWYDPELHSAAEAADTDPTGASWRALFAHANARYAIISNDNASPALRAALADAQMQRQAGNAQLWKLPQSSANGNDLVRERDLALARLRL